MYALTNNKVVCIVYSFKIISKILSNLFFTKAPWGKSPYSHFTEEETGSETLSSQKYYQSWDLNHIRLISRYSNSTYCYSWYLLLYTAFAPHFLMKVPSFDRYLDHSIFFPSLTPCFPPQEAQSATEAFFNTPREMTRATGALCLSFLGFPSTDCFSKPPASRNSRWEAGISLLPA